MNFGEALAALKEGKKVTRSVWGGYWVLIENVALEFDSQNDGPYPAYGMKQLILAVLRDDQGVAPAQPYQEDLLAIDWSIVE